jgi:hypothetical protein
MREGSRHADSRNNVIKKQAKIPFDFVLDRLDTAQPILRPMFGCYAIYVGKKMVLILRDRKDHPHDNGVWIATGEEHHAGLKKIFPNMRSIRLLGKKSAWQNLPSTSDDFETSAIEACEMILKNDPRIGKIPLPKKKKVSGS